MITLQDMHDDVLEMIYSYLNIEDCVNTNIALHKKIIASKVTKMYDTEKFKLIPKCYHKYIDLVPIIEKVSELKLYSDVCGISISSSCDIDLSFFNNLQRLSFILDDSEINIDVSSLTSLNYLDCDTCDINGVNSLINLIELDCSYTNIKYVNNLTKLRFLECSGTPIDNIDNLTNLEILYMDETYITRVNHLTKLQFLSCNDTDVEDIYNLVNLINLYCINTEISDISKLINLTMINCIGTKIVDISNLTKLKVFIQ
jgi:hypothetical protein